jgi:hypothetical protein
MVEEPEEISTRLHAVQWNVTGVFKLQQEETKRASRGQSMPLVFRSTPAQIVGSDLKFEASKVSACTAISSSSVLPSRGLQANHSRDMSPFCLVGVTYACAWGSSALMWGDVATHLAFRKHDRTA